MDETSCCATERSDTIKVPEKLNLNTIATISASFKKYNLISIAKGKMVRCHSQFQDVDTIIVHSNSVWRTYGVMKQFIEWLHNELNGHASFCGQNNDTKLYQKNV
jgi:hypothetical protein